VATLIALHDAATIVLISRTTSNNNWVAEEGINN
jgi:hypothetical protein